MIYVTGDIHGVYDICKLSKRSVRLEARKTGVANSLYITSGNYLIICGDFGLVWSSPPDAEEKYWLNWLNTREFVTLFVDGNHENFDLLNAYPVSNWCGGKVHFIRNRVIHLMRGEIYSIDGKVIYTMGGASSHDKDSRELGVSWWQDELPSPSDLDNALINLNGHNWVVDYVISHCAPTHISDELVSDYDTDLITDFHEHVYNNLEFKHWYGGHYHRDIDIDDYTCLYDKIIPIGATVANPFV